MTTPRSPSAFGWFCHGLGGQAQQVEAADQIDLDGAAETVQAMCAVTAKHLLGRRDAGAIDQPVQRTECRQRLCHCGLAILFASDVGAYETGSGAQLRYGLLACLIIDIQQQHLAALPDQLTGCGQAKTRGAAADQEYGFVDTHAQPL